MEHARNRLAISAEEMASQAGAVKLNRSCLVRSSAEIALHFFELLFGKLAFGIARFQDV